MNIPNTKSMNIATSNEIGSKFCFLKFSRVIYSINFKLSFVSKKYITKKVDLSNYWCKG